jgi:hypothetical protein
MTIASIPCPSCGQIIRNATANAANKLRCGACNTLFAIPMALSVPQAAAAQITDAPAEQSVEREAPPAHYGLLTAAAWAIGATAVILSIATLITGKGNSLVANPLSPRASSGALDTVACAAQIGTVALYALACFALVKCVSMITRLDRLAASLCWKRNVLRKPLGEPPGKSLLYILPFAVLGGVVLIAGLQLVVGNRSIGLSTRASTLNEPDWSWSSPAAGLVMAAVGSALLLAGMGAGELRRFFWRMYQFGTALAGSSKQNPSEDTLAGALRLPTASILVGGLAMYAFVFAHAIYEQMNAEMAQWTGRVVDAGPPVGVALLGMILLFTLLKIGLLSGAAVRTWSGHEKSDYPRSIRIFRCAVWIGFVGALFFDRKAFGGFLPGQFYETPFERNLLAAGGLLFIYLSGTLFDLNEFAGATVKMAGDQRIQTRSRRSLLVNLIFLLVFFVFLLRAIDIFDVASSSLSRPVVTRWWGYTPPPPGPFGITLSWTSFCLSTTFLALLPAVPVWWLGIFLQKLDQAKFNLEVANGNETA